MNAITSAPERPLHGSYASAAATRLRQAIAAAHGPLRDAVAAYRIAWASLTPDADLLDALRAAGSIVLAAEAIAEASKQLEATARTALASCMAETGCPAVALASHIVHLSTKPDRVDIENQQAIPAEFVRQPPPAPDKVAIGKRLRVGMEVPGARLIGNHEPICVFRSNRQ
jgi:hypothetical protein